MVCSLKYNVKLPIFSRKLRIYRPPQSSFCDQLPNNLEKNYREFDSSTPSSTSTGSPTENVPKNVCPSTCVVCGDTATGYHYDVGIILNVNNISGSFL